MNISMPPALRRRPLAVATIRNSFLSLKVSKPTPQPLLFRWLAQLLRLPSDQSSPANSLQMSNDEDEGWKPLFIPALDREATRREGT